MDPTTYYYTQTEAAFSLDVEAWVQSWAFPASALLGGGKGEGRGRSRASPATNETADRISQRYGGGRNMRRRVVNIDELDRPETVKSMEAAMGMSLPVASRARKEQAWNHGKRRVDQTKPKDGDP